MLTAVIIGSVLTPSATAAESFSVLLQKGIFAEETEGNLDAAIKIYEQITAEAAANRAVVAQAQYRLGVCYQKKGNKEQAISILNDLLKQFPAEAALGQKARELLAGLGQTPSSNITIRQFPLTADEVYSVSPDGRLVAYKPKENNDVVIYETATSKTWTAIKGTEKDTLRYNVIFSPDGRLIAYRLSDNLFYVARIDGSEAKQVYKMNELHEEMVLTGICGWSPDGGQLFLEHWDMESKSTSVFTVDVKSGTMKEIKRWPPSVGVGDMRLSWNGRYLAYGAGGAIPSQRKISVLDLESGAETTLIEKGVANPVGWSPGDARVLFWSDRTGATGLWAITVREGKPSGDPELVRAHTGDIDSVWIARDGSLYYTENRASQNVYLATANFQTGEISGQPRRVTDRFLGKQSIPVWSKDGQKLMVAERGERRLVAVSLAAGEQKEYPVSDTFVNYLQNYAWSPDGAFLLVQSWRTEVGHGIHRYELASGATETLVKTMNDQVPGYWICHPRLSPDGNSFYYERRDFFKGADERIDSKDRIIRRDLRSGHEEIVYESPEKLQIWWPYELSPDGERLAIGEFRTNDFVVALKVRGVSGGHETKEVVRLAAPREGVSSLAWTPDGQRLVYTKNRASKDKGADPQMEVWSTAVDSGQSVELKFSQPGIRDISLHPDGRQIAFCAGSGGRDVWVLEGLMLKPVAPTARTTKN
jgi:Tol biopolymer transport system component